MGFASIGLLFTGVATGLQVYSQMQQGQTQERIAQYNNDLAQQEATNKELETSEAIKRARINERKQAASIRASLSSTGTNLSTGTPLMILGETAANFQTSVSDAARSANMEANSMRQQGRMALWEGKVQSKASRLGAIASGISGATQAVSAFGHNRYTGAI